jgi:hypothetical protein
MIRKLLLVGAAALVLAGCAAANAPPLALRDSPLSPRYSDSDTRELCAEGYTAYCSGQRNDAFVAGANTPRSTTKSSATSRYGDSDTRELCAEGYTAYCALSGQPTPPPPSSTLSGQPTSPPPSSARAPTANGRSEIALHGSGTFTVPVTINGAITLEFTLDSGASDVSIPADVVMTLMRTGTIDRSDFLGSRTYVMADGSTAPSTIFRIRSLRVGDHEVRNVTGSIAPVKGSLLLGQSFLRQFGAWSIDNRRGVLVLD